MLYMGVNPKRKDRQVLKTEISGEYIEDSDCNTKADTLPFPLCSHIRCVIKGDNNGNMERCSRL
jgi:hypothetical protein